MATWRLVVVKPASVSWGSDHGASGLDARLEASPSVAILRLLPAVAMIVGIDGCPHWPSCHYLAHVGMCSRSMTGDTVRTYAESILVWLDYLEGSHRPECAVSVFDLKTYRGHLARQKNKRLQQPISKTTANARLGAVIRYYRWCESAGTLSTSLGRWALEQQQLRAGWRSSLPAPAVERLSPYVDTRMPRILTVDQLRQLFESADLPYSLIFKWAVCTGMRRFELCSLSLSTAEMLFQGGAPYAFSLARMDILRKGSKSHSVYAPTKLVDETRWYIEIERPLPVTGCEDLVFLNRRGSAITKTALSDKFREAANKIGSDATLHHLRHTFAIIVLDLLQRRADNGSSINPLKTLQVLMGHAHLETTEVYLRALEINSDTVRETLEFLFGAVS